MICECVCYFMGMIQQNFLKFNSFYNYCMDRYEIIDMIDEGAYGIVWKATSKESGALVAIKQFKEGDDDEMSRKSIQREIRMLKMLKSEYIVNIKQAFKKRNKVFLIFEYFPKNLLNVIEIFERGLEVHPFLSRAISSIKLSTSSSSVFDFCITKILCIEI